MGIKNLVKKNRFLDSVLLMSISNQLKKLDGVLNASVIMGSDNNKELLDKDGLLDDEGKNASPNDLIIALSFSENIDSKKLLEDAEKSLSERKKTSDDTLAVIPKTIPSALNIMPEANVVVISLPGEYAAIEAENALEAGLHVMLFSDNVTIEEEVELKKLAREKGLLLMGPDCGTSIINNVALGFANIVNNGNIGIVGASGTGIQEVTSLLSNAGLGISQAIGTGGRDLSKHVGGLTMIGALEALIEDPATEIILLISKPPSPEVEDKILDILATCPKPFVINFLGGNVEKIKARGYRAAKTLEEAATLALAWSKYLEDKDKKSGFSEPDPSKIEGLRATFELRDSETLDIGKKEWTNFAGDQKYIRGLYSGGSLCEEANIVLQDLGFEINSNAPLKPELKLQDSKKSIKHTFVDMGDDEFTKGVPHPMIDFTRRKERIIQEANDPECAVILMDVVLGLGSHDNPAGEIVSAVSEAKEIAAKNGRYISVIVSITGTAKDPQNRDVQKKLLENAGVIVMPTNARAARFAGLVANKGKLDF